MVILILFFGIITSLSGPRKGKLSKDAELITKALTGQSDSALVQDNKVDAARINDFVISPDQYNELKSQLGVKGDFCIYFEDSEGNLVPVLLRVDDPDPTVDGDETYYYVNGVGDDGAMINDHPCGQQYTKNG